ncbi:hypothetical protein HRM2_29950 [Desulforapulum autotrophicum HRM2]|uniref:Radical SAM protein n=1 Tax=Desulforapulum autotrophicum (strain ATCC 43914 / DSM 3382 / VKM B-1955 / HRM2) TaxID=177437 RepID=C0QK52_DESAH|nr:radical SAM protein [Desulforapulum autotrophicum]ACN16078.1 hypothetical protein HRM2_29950 [Desulforapulum autotrophicum HRM2]
MEHGQLQDINFFTTYRCNSRCRNCFIWREPHDPGSRTRLASNELERFFEDPLVRNCPNVGLAGGEPTIAPFFWEVLEIIPRDKHVTITTNALKSDRLVAFLADNPHRERFMVQVSLDGIGAVNDNIRGIAGAFKKTVDLLEKLKNLGVPRLVSFTINRTNFMDLEACYGLAEKNGAGFSTRMAYCGGAYTNRESRELFHFAADELVTLENSIDRVVSKELNRSGHYLPQLVFMEKIVDYYRGAQTDIPCHAMTSGMVIDLYGDVFPNCPAIMTSIGNLKNNSLSDIWEGPKAEAVRRKIQKIACGGCWNDCQVVTNIACNRAFLDRESTEIKLREVRGKAFPQGIDFNCGESPLILNGWYVPEGSDAFRYCWTTMEFSIIVPQGATGVQFFAMPCPGTNSENPLVLTARGGEAELGRISLENADWGDFSLSFLRPAEKMGACSFSLGRCFCPKENGQGVDKRKLGLAVQRISFLKTADLHPASA